MGSMLNERYKEKDDTHLWCWREGGMLNGRYTSYRSLSRHGNDSQVG